jgi:hypothetical protein
MTLTVTSKDVVAQTPLLLSLELPPQRISLANQTGMDPLGRPFVRVALPNGQISPGESVKVVLKFANPLLQTFSFVTVLNSNSPVLMPNMRIR